jgi:hypothetical protein
MLPGMRWEARGEGGVMPPMLTLVPIAWTWEAGQNQAIAYSVYDLPSEKLTVISIGPGGWRVVRHAPVEFDQGKLYPSAEEAAAALKAWIQGESSPPKAEE